MCRRVPERLPLTNKQQPEACYRKGHEQIGSVLNVTRSRAVCIETDVNCCKETKHLFRWRQKKVAKIVQCGEQSFSTVYGVRTILVEVVTWRISTATNE